MIGMLAEPPMRAGRWPIDAHHPRAPATRAHQSFNATSTDPLSVRLQRARNPRAPIRPATLLEDRTDVLE
jgi:hypothetical protein